MKFLQRQCIISLVQNLFNKLGDWGKIREEIDEKEVNVSLFISLLELVSNAIWPDAKEPKQNVKWLPMSGINRGVEKFK